MTPAKTLVTLIKHQGILGASAFNEATVIPPTKGCESLVGSVPQDYEGRSVGTTIHSRRERAMGTATHGRGETVAKDAIHGNRESAVGDAIRG